MNPFLGPSDEDSLSLSSGASQSTDIQPSRMTEEEERDEVKEVKKLAARESTVVDVWRWVVVFMVRNTEMKHHVHNTNERNSSL